MFFFFFQAEDGIRDGRVTGVQTCALPILRAAVGALFTHILREQDGLFPASLSVLRPQDWERLDAVRAEVDARGDRTPSTRSEERRVGKECRSRWSREQ